MAEIRPARVDDIPAIVRYGAEMVQESRYRGMSFAPDKVGQIMRAVITESQGAGFVAEVAGQIVGGAFAVLTAPWFSHDPTACDLAVFVAPEHRRNGVAVQLVQAVLWWAQQIGVHHVDLSISTGVEAEATGRLYEKLGGSFVGGIYTWRLADV
jgi:GNAT superfamily N-acetyltransferase